MSNAAAQTMKIDGAIEREVGKHYALLWSQAQNCFHVEPIARMLQANRRAYSEDRAPGYAPVFIGTSDECFDLADALRGTLRSREEARQVARDELERVRQAAAGTSVRGGA